MLPILFIALGGIGVPGGAVYVRTSFMTKRQKTIVSLAGPLTNVAFAVILLAVTALFYDPDHIVFWAGMAFSGLPSGDRGACSTCCRCPGLDGYSALEPHLSHDTQRALAPAKQWGLFVLFCAVHRVAAQPVLLRRGHLVRRPLRRARRFLVGIGLRLTQFWSAWL